MNVLIIKYTNKINNNFTAFSFNDEKSFLKIMLTIKRISINKTLINEIEEPNTIEIGKNINKA